MTPRAVLVASTLFLLSGCSATAGAPKFIPTGKGLFEGFVALGEPRVAVPVGALWVQNFGPYGQAAEESNVETVRSLSGISLNRDLQLKLTLGIVNLLNLDPGFSGNVTAQFSDLSIVRVKDMSRLAGAKGEPRIYEALKAGSVTVRTQNEVGLDISGNLKVKGIQVSGASNGGRSRTFTIEAKDMFIAIKVGSLETTRTQVQTLVLRTLSDRVDTSVHGVPVTGSGLTLNGCLSVTAPLRLKAGASEEGKADLDASLQGVSIPLPLPVADGEGGVLDTLVAKLRLKPGSRAAKPCRPELLLTLQGYRLAPFSQPRPVNW